MHWAAVPGWPWARGARCRRRAPASPSRSVRSSATLVSSAAVARDLGPTLAGPVTGYAFVYVIEIALLIGTIVALGPLVRGRGADPVSASTRFGLSEFPI